MLRGDHSEAMIEQELGAAVLSDRARVREIPWHSRVARGAPAAYRRQIRSPARDRKTHASRGYNEQNSAVIAAEVLPCAA